MKARIPSADKNKNALIVKKEEKNEEFITNIEAVIDDFAKKEDINIDRYKAMLYYSIFENSDDITLDDEFISFIKNMYATKNAGVLFKKILEDGKKRYESKLPFLSRATMKLDQSLIVNLSATGYTTLPKITIDEHDRLEKIREVLVQIENTLLAVQKKDNFYKIDNLEEKAILLALEKNLLPEEEEILKFRLENIALNKKSHTIPDNEER